MATGAATATTKATSLSEFANSSSAIPTLTANQYSSTSSFSPNSLSEPLPPSLSITSSGFSSQTAIPSNSSSHASKAGSIAAGVVITVAILISAALFALFYLRRCRKREDGTWKRLSRSTSLLSAPSTEGAISTKDELQKDFPLSSHPRSRVSKVEKFNTVEHFRQEETNSFGSLPSHPPLSFQKPTLIYIGPTVNETDHRVSTSSFESVPEYTELDDKMLESNVTSTVKDGPEQLPPALIAGQRGAIQHTAPPNNYQVRTEEVRTSELHLGDATQYPARTYTGISPGSYGSAWRSNVLENRKPIKRKPLL
jgi:hypothetical protein